MDLRGYWWINPDQSNLTKYWVETQYVQAVFDLDCEWQGLPPVYRIYVNDELFTEREWRWTEHYLEEILQLQVMPGVYKVRLDPVGPNMASFRCSNHRIAHGVARWRDHETLEVLS